MWTSASELGEISIFNVLLTSLPIHHNKNIVKKCSKYQRIKGLSKIKQGVGESHINSLVLQGP